MTDLLFLYGTLMRGMATPEYAGEVVARLQAETARIGTARLRGRLYRVTDYPALVPDDAAEWVIGELVRLPAQPTPLLALLDAYEECTADLPAPREYRREKRQVEGPDGPVSAWVYAYNRPVEELPRIPCGDWQAFLTCP